MTKTKQAWMMTTALVLLILAVAYMLGVKPQANKVKSLNAEAETQARANTQLRGEIQRLEKQRAKVPASELRVKQIGRSLPSHPALPKLIRDISKFASQSGVDLVSLTPGTPTALTKPEPVKAAPASEDEGGAKSAPAKPVTPNSAAAKPAPTVDVGTLTAIQLAINVKGDFSELVLFLSKLEDMERSMVLGTVSVVFNKPTAATAKSAGPLTLDVAGQVFMVSKAAAAPVKAAAKPVAATSEK